MKSFLDNLLEEKLHIPVNISDGVNKIKIDLDFPMITIKEVLKNDKLLKDKIQDMLEGEDTNWEEGLNELLEKYGNIDIDENILIQGKPILGTQIYNQLFSFWYGIEQDKKKQNKTATGRQKFNDFDEIRDFIAPLEYAAHRWGQNPAELMKTMSFPEFKMGLEGLGYNVNAESEEGQKTNERDVAKRYVVENKEEMNKEAEEIIDLLN